MGSGLSVVASTARKDHAHESGLTAAVLNVGFVLFDHLIDSGTEPECITRHLDATTLRELHDERAAAEKLRQSVALVGRADVSALMKIIAGFFDRVHDSRAEFEQRALPEALLVLLQDSFAAELESSRRLSVVRALAVSRAKSTSPFQIMSQVARLELNLPQSGDDAIESVPEDLGCIFWLADDLADIVIDERVQSLNSVLLKLRLKLSETNSEARDESSLELLMESSDIEEAVSEMCRYARAVSGTLDRLANGDRRVLHFKRSITNYVRNWFPVHVA